MKHPLETLLSAAGILLLALLSCLPLPAPSLGLTLKAGWSIPYDGSQPALYGVVCLWFLALGAIEYLVLRWVASLVFARTLNQKGAPQWARLWFSLRWRPAAD